MALLDPVISTIAPGPGGPGPGPGPMPGPHPGGSPPQAGCEPPKEPPKGCEPPKEPPKACDPPKEPPKCEGGDKHHGDKYDWGGGPHKPGDWGSHEGGHHKYDVAFDKGHEFVPTSHDNLLSGLG